MATFKATFTESEGLQATFSTDQNLDAVFGEVIGIVDIDHFDGPYEVESTVTKTQTLETEGKYMLDDVTISPVPIWRTGNVSGITVYIGRTEE